MTVESGNIVDFAPIVAQVIQAIAYIVIAILAYWLQGHVKDENSRQAVLDAAENGVNSALNRLGQLSKGTLSVPMSSKVGAMAVDYVLNMVPGAVARLGLDEKSIAKLVVAKLPAVSGGQIDDKTLDNIASRVGASGQTPTDWSAVIAALEPVMAQAAQAEIAKHFAKMPQAEPTPPPAQPAV